MRNYPTIASIGRESKKVVPSVPRNAIPKAKNRFYALRTWREKSYESDNDVGTSL